MVQVQIPPHLCHPGELHFSKANLTPEEADKERAVNRVLPRPHHPKLDCIDTKHPTHCLAAAVHYTLHQKLFDKFKDSQSNIADHFLVEHKKFFTSITGCRYNAGKKFMKAEKKEKEAKEMQLQKKKLQKLGQPAKVEKQGEKKEEPQKEEDDAPMDTDDMPLLISDTDSNDDTKGMKKKWIVHKKPTKPPLRKK